MSDDEEPTTLGEAFPWLVAQYEDADVERPFAARCPNDPAHAVVESDWWDDPPENGGACIGVRVRCTECGWSEDR
jgi:hypothetical protein